MVSALNLGNTTGAFLVGVFFEVWLFGFTCLQTWYYFQHYPTDGRRLKSLVLFIWCLEALHAAFSCHAAYFWLVTNYANPVALNDSIWSADAALIVAGNLVFVVHCFFCYRVWAVSGRRWLMPCVILTLALGSWATDWAVFSLSVVEALFSSFGHKITVVSTTGLVFKVATDIAVAVSLGYFLHRNKSGIRRTDHLANQLIFWAVNVGILTSIVDVLVLAFSEAESNLIYLAIFTIVGNLYSNSLLATLNIRGYARTQVLGEDGTTLPMDTIKFSDQHLESDVKAGSTMMFQTSSRGTIPELPIAAHKPSFPGIIVGVPDASLAAATYKGTPEVSAV